MAPHEVYRDRFVGVEPAWHRLGKPIKPGTKAVEAMALAGQSNWNVRSLPLDMPGIDGQGLYVIVRDEEVDGQVISRVASEQLVEASYAPISNEEVFTGLTDLLVGESLPVDAAGVLGRLGNRAFMTFKAGDRVFLPGGESYDRYLIALARHTGRHSVQILPSGVRVVCANTELLALQIARVMLTIEHNAASLNRFYENAESARALLGLTAHWETRMRHIMEPLMEVEFTGRQWAKVTSKYVALGGEAKTERQEASRFRTGELLANAWGSEAENAVVLGQPHTSLWTARQAISTYAQHYARGGDRGRDLRAMNMATGEVPPMVKSLQKLVFDEGRKRGITRDVMTLVGA